MSLLTYLLIYLRGDGHPPTYLGGDGHPPNYLGGEVQHHTYKYLGGNGHLHPLIQEGMISYLFI